MLTSRRSASGWAEACLAGADATRPALGLLALADPAEAPNGVAHSEQNLAPARLTKPQFGQPALSGAAHSMQNFAPATFSVEQLGQIKVATGPLHRVDCAEEYAQFGLVTSGMEG
jgi:hypothetical protein